MVNRYKTMSFVVLVLVVSLGITGCEPLRKKFTRKKKEASKVAEFVPVLQPEEYAAPEVDPVAEYKRRYGLWRTWYDEFIDGLEETGSNKRQQYFLGQMITQCEEMEKFLNEEPLTHMQEVLKKLNDVKQTLNSPIPLRNTTIVKNKVSAINVQIREKLKPEQVQDILKK